MREDFRPSLSAIETVPIDSLLPADSPRRVGEDIQHVRSLSDLDVVLPPIIAHRPTMRIMDGMHRLRAAALRGEKTIRVRYFEGDEHDAFVIAVRENIAHGLPLSAGDRSAAADRIVRSYPHWSDRAIARIAGLSARTVSDIRRAAFPGDAQLVARLGRDGRTRPLDSSAGRIRAAELITKGPQASLRQIAQQAGISPGTVRDVRDRLRRGENPSPISPPPADARPDPASQNRKAASDTPPQAAPPTSCPASVSGPSRDRSRTSRLNTLVKDPSLRSGELGRLLLRILSSSASLTPSWEQLIAAVPEHCVGLVSEVAKENAVVWTKFADDLERRTARSGARTKK